MVIHATLSNCTLGKALFISTNQVSFFFENSCNKVLTICTLPGQSLKSIAQMATGFFEKGSNMYGFNEIILKTTYATLTVYPNNTCKEITELLLNLTNITALDWATGDD